jgi:hypothetical protein
VSNRTRTWRLRRTAARTSSLSLRQEPPRTIRFEGTKAVAQSRNQFRTYGVHVEFACGANCQRCGAHLHFPARDFSTGQATSPRSRRRRSAPSGSAASVPPSEGREAPAHAVLGLAASLWGARGCAGPLPDTWARTAGVPEPASSRRPTSRGPLPRHYRGPGCLGTSFGSIFGSILAAIQGWLAGQPATERPALDQRQTSLSARERVD